MLLISSSRQVMVVRPADASGLLGPSTSSRPSDAPPVRDWSWYTHQAPPRHGIDLADGCILVAQDQELNIRDVATSRTIRTISTGTFAITAAAVYRGFAITGHGGESGQPRNGQKDSGHEVRLWLLQPGKVHPAGRRACTLKGHTTAVCSLCVVTTASGAPLLASAAEHGFEVRLWAGCFSEVAKPACAAVLTPPEDRASASWLLSLGRGLMLVAGGLGCRGRQLWVWRLPAGLGADAAPLACAGTAEGSPQIRAGGRRALAPLGGGRVVVGTHQGELREYLWDDRAGRLRESARGELPPHMDSRSKIAALAAHPSDDRLLASSGGTVWAWRRTRPVDAAGAGLDAGGSRAAAGSQGEAQPGERVVWVREEHKVTCEHRNYEAESLAAVRRPPHVAAVAHQPRPHA